MIKRLKDHIDIYIGEKIDSTLDETLVGLIEAKLIPLAQSFMRDHLTTLLNRLIEEALEEAIHRIMSDFEIQEVSDMKEVSQDLPSNDLQKLLAFLQHYQAAHGLSAKPPRSLIQKHLSFPDIHLSKLMSRLRDEKYITDTMKSLHVEKPLDNPSYYLNNPL